MIVLNESSDCYTFSGMTGQSDIDVTLVSRELAGCQFEWDVRGDQGSHNVILIRMMYGKIDEGEICECKKWVGKNVNWEEYKNDLIEVAGVRGMAVLDEVDID